MRLFSGFLAVDGSFFTHGSEDNNVNVLAFLDEELLDLVASLAIRDLDVVLSGAVVGHEGEEIVVSHIKELVFLATNVGNIHVMGGWAKFFELLASEDVNGNEMDFGVTVLAGLGGGHVYDLAGTVLDDDETVLSESRTLHGVGRGGASIGALEGVLLMLGVVGHNFGMSGCIG